LDDHTLMPNNLLLLTPFAVVTSNAIGSLPAAMLLLQVWPTPPPGVLYGLAVVSSLAGNLLLSGSLTNILIAERAERIGARLSFPESPRAGAPTGVLPLPSPLGGPALTNPRPLPPVPTPPIQPP